MWRLGVQVGCLPLLLSTPPPPGQAFSLSSEFTDWLDWLPPSSMDSTAQRYRLISTHSALYMKAGDPNSSCFQSRHFICHPKPLVVFVQQIKQKCFQFIHRQCTNATAGPLSPTSSTSHTHSYLSLWTQLTLSQTITKPFGQCNSLLTDTPTEKDLLFDQILSKLMFSFPPWGFNLSP